MMTWFLVEEEEEAEEIASIVTTEEYAPEDWTYLESPLITLELMALFAALRGTEDVVGQEVLEKPLVEEEGLLVARVADPFIQALARVSDDKLPAATEAWIQRLDQEHHEPEYLRELLAELACFSREAVARQCPVLVLTTF
ncbi:MAG TPA: hypothetical protein VLQ93_09515 [Myxococcaceae bacterium]|nr:hypothetical protein [Myxococcaceae bacterium]